MKSTLSILFVILSLSLSAQLNRYPYIQSTSQHSTIIAWKTANDVLGKVAYGLSPIALTDTVYETTAVKRHALSLNGLEENTKYYYTIFSDNQALASEYFSTASDSTDQDFSFIQYGDCGFNTTVQSTLGSLMEADDASFAVVCGDVDQGGVPHISQSAGGDNYDDIFFNIYNNGTTHKMLSRECHYTSIGNHDVYANNGATYDLEFHLPHNNADSSERYYSFTWGDAKFIALDVITPFDPTAFPLNQKPISERWWTDFRPGSPQYEFLVNELQCNDKKWVFIYFHEGPWTNYWGADYYLPNALGGDYYQFDGNAMVRQHLVPLFEQYDVDFVLCGHSHLYEQAEKNGVMYITSGGAGDVGGNTQYANHPEILKSIIQNHYIKFSVDGNTVSYDVINASNDVIDSFSLSKNYVEYQVSSTITDVSCHGAVDGSISLNIQGPKGPYTVEWFDGSSGPNKSGLGAGTYYAYIKNAFNCEKVSSFTINEPAILVPEILSNSANYTFCDGDSIALYANDSYVNYFWSNGSNDSLNYVSQAGNITLSVVDNNGCLASSNSINIQELNFANPYFGYASNSTTYNFLCGEQNANYYYWDFGDNVYDTTTTNIVNHSYTANGLYEVRLSVENECGISSYFREIEIDAFATGITTNFIENAIKIIPNPFHSSTEVSIKGMGKEFNVHIYNVLGMEVYQSIERSSKFIIKRNNLADGNYFLRISDESGNYSNIKLILN